jgi:hypothetical protein
MSENPQPIAQFFSYMLDSYGSITIAVRWACSQIRVYGFAEKNAVLCYFFLLPCNWRFWWWSKILELIHHHTLFEFLHRNLFLLMFTMYSECVCRALNGTMAQGTCAAEKFKSGTWSGAWSTCTIEWCVSTISHIFTYLLFIAARAWACAALSTNFIY